MNESNETVRSLGYCPRCGAEMLEEFKWDIYGKRWERKHTWDACVDKQLRTMLDELRGINERLARLEGAEE